MLVFFAGEDVSIDNAEERLTERVRRTVCEIMGAYYEKRDRELREDKEFRQAVGLQVERRNEPRSVLTKFGEVSYRRTYYEGREGYCYPIDEIARVDSRQRISRGVSQELVERTIDFSYDKSRKIVTKGAVSKQTVMNKIRQSQVPETESKPLKLHARVLHIDADEDHVNLQNGKNTIVPIICVYEGIEKIGKRGRCINKHTYSAYGKKPEALWREVYKDLEKTYDLTGTKTYIHGDGAKWIQSGKDSFPGSRFVLDAYHKNKAIKALFSGSLAKKREDWEGPLREAMEAGDGERCEAIIEGLINTPGARKPNEEAGEYLLNNLEGILLYYVDEEARKGGATEPHVSHILSSRLSSRPMGWSEETLKSFVPILAAKKCEILKKEDLAKRREETKKKEIKRKPKVRTGLGLPDPDKALILNVQAKKESMLYKILHSPFGHWIGAPNFSPTIS